MLGMILLQAAAGAGLAKIGACIGAGLPLWLKVWLCLLLLFVC